MSVYTTTKSEIAGRAATLYQSLDATFLRIQQYKAFLDTLLDSDLIAYGFAQADINVLRSSLVDVEQLRTIYQGTASLAVAKDFRTFTKSVFPFGSF